MERRTALITGIDIPIPECQLTLHQPTIEEISYLTRDDFFSGIQTLTLNKSMYIKDETDLYDVSNFQLFMMVMDEEETKEKKEAVKQVFTLIFPKYKVQFTPRALLFMGENGFSVTIDDTNFDSLQEVLKDVFCVKTGPMDQQSFNPQGKKAREIAEKLMKGRQRVAEQKGEATVDVFTLYISILSVGLGLPITILKNYTMFMLYDQLERFSLYTSWDLDIKSRLAGGKPEGQPPDWMKNLH